MLVTILLVLVPSLASQQVRQPSRRVASLPPLPAGFFAIAGSDASLPVDDLLPLDSMVGDAEIVALGESVHCSGGFYEAKDRLLRYLVEELGFRAFAIESPWQQADLVGEYVLNGSGTLRNAMTGLFNVWESREVAAMVEWMHLRNQANPADPVFFFGFDIQQPNADGPDLIAFVEAVHPAPDRLAGDIDTCSGVGRPWLPVYEADNATCTAALDAVEQYFVQQQEDIVAASSQQELDWAWVYLIGLRSWQGLAWSMENGDIPASYDSRDRGMADVLLRIRELRCPGVKTVIWAHNWHIAQRTDLMVTDAEFGTASSMGTYLAAELGSAYAPIALAAYTTRHYWPWLDPEVQELVVTSGVEHRLHAYQRPGLLVDSTAAALCPPTEPCMWTWPDYAASTQDWADWSMVFEPWQQFRAVLFLDGSPAMVPLGR